MNGPLRLGDFDYRIACSSFITSHFILFFYIIVSPIFIYDFPCPEPAIRVLCTASWPERDIASLGGCTNIFHDPCESGTTVLRDID